ncbi:MAG: DoxX family protein [Bacteroidetes bacterium]|nr:DoxX family protein [Bacteroidota bacterium]
MNNITNWSRILVGALFVVSGLIKANDPSGFAYKLEEYLAPDALNWTIFEGSELFLSIVICIGEIVLGIALLVGEKVVLTVWLLLLMIIFFTFLTGYTAIGNWFVENYDKSSVHWWEGLLGFKAREQFRMFSDCGCFGDALKLTPWQSFMKDVVLLVLIVWLFIKRKSIKAFDTVREDFKIYVPALILIALFSLGVIRWAGPIWFSIVVFAVVSLIKSKTPKSPMQGWLMAAGAVVVTLVFTLYCYKYIPIRDYRPYAVGNNILELMQVPEGENEMPVEEITLIYKHKETGEIVRLPMDQMSGFDFGNHEFIEQEKKVIEPAFEPPIHDLVITDANGEDLTEQILNYNGYQVWHVMYTIKKSDRSVIPEMQKTVAALQANGIPNYNLTSSGEDDQKAWDPNMDFYSCDQTTLKTMIRSNPGVILLKGPVIVKKWPAASYPSFEEIDEAMKNGQ